LFVCPPWAVLLLPPGLALALGHASAPQRLVEASLMVGYSTLIGVLGAAFSEQFSLNVVALVVPLVAFTAIAASDSARRPQRGRVFKRS
jgi:hypothetical protein